VIVSTPSSQPPKTLKDFPDQRAYVAYLTDLWGIPIGISMLGGEDREVRNTEEYEQRKSIEYHGIVKRFDTTKLNKTQKEILFILENRAKEYHGETKIYNKRIAALIEKSVSTVEKSIRKLEEEKFISTYSTRYFRKGKFYSDRIIRCKRTWIESQCKIAKTSAWRYCRRPENTKGVYILGEHKELDIIEGIVKFSPEINFAIELGWYDPEENEKYHEYLNWRDFYGYEEGVARLGYKKKIPFDYLIPIPPDKQRKMYHIKKPEGVLTTPERQRVLAKLPKF